MKRLQGYIFPPNRLRASISVNCEMGDFTVWHPNQIKAFMNGVAGVLAVQPKSPPETPDSPQTPAPSPASPPEN